MPGPSPPAFFASGLAGTVRDEQGAPLPGARVAVADEATRRDTLAGDDGAWRVIDLAPGAYTVTAETEGFATGRQEAEVRPNATTRVDVTLVSARGGAG